MISLEDFELSPVVNSIFESNSWIKGESLVLNLEQYKFLTRDQIIKVFRNKGILVENISTVSESNSEIIRRLEIENNVKISVISPTKVIVVHSIFNKVEEAAIRLNLHFAEVSFIPVTPFNYLELSGKDIPSWDYRVLIRRLVLECIRQKGRDIHFDTEFRKGEFVYPVYFRIGELLYPCNLFNLSRRDNKELIYDLVQMETNAYSGDLETMYGVTASMKDVFGDGKVSLRISANKVYNGYMCVCRVQQVRTTAMTISELGFSREIEEDLRIVSNKKSGITLATGAINTGKNTTLFAMANEVVNTGRKIVDYSYPIEVLMPFPQIDYGGNPEYLANAVRLAKKQDINIAIVNEIPTKDVAFAVRDLAYSSVHVMTTMHINRIWHLPYRLEEYYGSDFKMMFSHMNMCVTQKMFQIQCPSCRTQKLVSSLPTRYRELLERFDITSYWVTEGCKDCKGFDKEVKIQPFMERLVFSYDIVKELLKLNYPHEMEQVIQNAVIRNKASLEYYICPAIGSGDLAVESLDSIL